MDSKQNPHALGHLLGAIERVKANDRDEAVKQIEAALWSLCDPAEHERVERFNQPNDARDMIGCDDDDCTENAKVKVRFKSARVRFYCREHGSRVTGIPIMKLP